MTEKLNEILERLRALEKKTDIRRATAWREFADRLEKLDAAIAESVAVARQTLELWGSADTDTTPVEEEEPNCTGGLLTGMV